ncbi:hypothetical protein [Curtobacterium sp. Curtsp57]|uniref:hypothetical protein n=1 Tax=Curtobacterium sp. Curtsp57 TaxID=3243047 RepID=UPI0039B4BE25
MIDVLSAVELCELVAAGIEAVQEPFAERAVLIGFDHALLEVLDDLDELGFLTKQAPRAVLGVQ